MSTLGATTTAAPVSYGTTYAAPTTYAVPAYGAGMSYVPPATGYGGYGASPYLDVTVIETQKKDAVNALTNQHKLQADMLKAEFTRNVTMATQQFEQQMLQ